MNLTQPLTPAYYLDVERQLKRIFYEILFMPIIKIIQHATPQAVLINANDDDPLRLALRTGRIQYANGVFSGELSALISKVLRRLGAKFDRNMGVYRLRASLIPWWVISEATSYAMEAKATHEAVLRALNETQQRLDQLVKDRPVNADFSIAHIEHGFKKSAEHIMVSPRLSPASRDALRREYSNNMNIWIDKFSREEIQALRKRVEINALRGYRFDHLIDSIKSRYSVSENKAKFLARQETALFLSNFRKQRFKEGGVKRYRWSTVHDKRVRHDHRKLDKKVYYYDDPPITDDATGAKNNPGGDYNCRCVDIPVLDGLDR